MQVFRTVALFVALALLAGCAATKHRSQMEDFETHWRSGNYPGAAAMFVDPEGNLDELENLNLFELLHFAEAARLSGDLEAAVAAYDLTEDHFKRFDEDNLAEEAAKTVGSILVNDTVTAYEGHLYEAILSNSYKAMAFLSLGQPDLARIELNRADDRTRRAVEYFAKLIEEEKKALQDNEQQEAQAVVKTLESDDLNEAVISEYGSVDEWAVYPTFINPFVTYLHAMYFLVSDVSGDSQRAIDSLKRVSGMTDNPYVQEDLELAQMQISGTGSDIANGRLWIVYENGLGPVLEERRIDVPIFLVSQSSRVPYTGIALPDMDRGIPAAQNLSVTFSDESGMRRSLRTAPLADMEKVARTEFKRKFSGILARSLASAAVKAVVQAAATEEFGVWGQLAGGVLTAATTQADLRSWRAMPSRWDALSMKRPADGRIQLSTGNGSLIREFELPDWKHTLLYIKQPTASSRPAVFFVDLSGRRSFESERYVAN